MKVNILTQCLTKSIGWVCDSIIGGGGEDDIESSRQVKKALQSLDFIFMIVKLCVYCNTALEIVRVRH